MPLMTTKDGLQVNVSICLWRVRYFSKHTRPGWYVLERNKPAYIGPYDTCDDAFKAIEEVSCLSKPTEKTLAKTVPSAKRIMVQASSLGIQSWRWDSAPRSLRAQFLSTFAGRKMRSIP